MNPMRVVIQDRESHLYFRRSDRWTANVDQATDFEHIHLAREFAREARLPNMDVVMIFGSDGRPGLRVPASP
jgi:hypothetical protein